jgi:hypothetical protein
VPDPKVVVVFESEAGAGSRKEEEADAGDRQEVAHHPRNCSICCTPHPTRLPMPAPESDKISHGVSARRIMYFDPRQPLGLRRPEGDACIPKSAVAPADRLRSSDCSVG